MTAKVTYIASTVESFEDYINSDICDGTAIHCTFPFPVFGLDFYIKRTLVKKKIEYISFTDGHKLFHPLYN
ncbi:hypothetical protein ACPV4A_13895 [Vibrio rotiferianus]|uniref:hypothetical protein n=1 Tax=Vibrio rotiferianus TaxID=190895 RepID=UPI00406A5CF2